MDWQKMMKTANWLDVFLKTLQRILIIALAVSVLVLSLISIIGTVNPEAMIGDYAVIDVGEIAFELVPGQTPDSGSMIKYMWMMILPAAALGGVLFYCIRCFRKILSSMKAGEPFYADAVKDLRKCSYAVLAFGVIDYLADAVNTLFVMQHFDIASFLNKSVVSSVTVKHTLDLTFLLVFFVLRLMSYLFAYGVELQKLSDETL